MNDATPNPRNILTPETWVPLGVVFAVFGGILAGVIWLNSRLQSIDFRLQNVEEKLNIGANDRWTGADMRTWALILRADNPALKVPDVERTPR